MNSRASLLFVLHAHLPFVNHPASSSFLEENWFFEAVAETYVPLIRMFERLAADHIRPGITLSVSPTLGAMFENEELKEKLFSYLESRLEILGKEKIRLKKEKKVLKALAMYERLYLDSLDLLHANGGSLIIPLRALQRAGQIEIITTSATHAVLPLLIRKEAVRAQVAVAATDYESRFGIKPKGFWLPECAYEPSLNAYLRMSGFKYSFAESHSIDGMSDKAVFGVFSSYRSPNGMNFFIRDSFSSAEVWSARNGYPGNPAYREFYRDLGFDADLDYIRPYLGEGGTRHPLGIKYYRITDSSKDLSGRDYYDPDKAMAQVEKDAADYVRRRIEQSAAVSMPGREPLIVNCYDAELFGHWWFEGPAFLENVIRRIRKERLPLRFVTPSEYQAAYPQPPELVPGVSSWGEKGYFEPWVNPSNDWIYRNLFSVTDKMIDAANFFKTRHLMPLQRRALNQAAREVLLAQSSDWAFLIYIGSHAAYAKRRFAEHVNSAAELLEKSIQNNINEQELLKLELKNNIFPNMDFRLFSSPARY